MIVHAREYFVGAVGGAHLAAERGRGGEWRPGGAGAGVTVDQEAGVVRGAVERVAAVGGGVAVVRVHQMPGAPRPEPRRRARRSPLPRAPAGRGRGDLPCQANGRSPRRSARRRRCTAASGHLTWGGRRPGRLIDPGSPGGAGFAIALHRRSPRVGDGQGSERLGWPPGTRHRDCSGARLETRRSPVSRCRAH